MNDEHTDTTSAPPESAPAAAPSSSAPDAAGGTDEDLSAEAAAEALARTAKIVMCFTLSALVAIVVLLGLAFYRLNDLNDTEAGALSMRWFVLATIAIAGTIALGGVFIKMKRGIRQQNLRAVGIVLVLLLASMLAVVSDDYEPVYGLLGGVAGYLFGKDESAREDPGK